MVFSHLYSFISSAHLYRASLPVRDAFWMYSAEQGAFLAVFGSLAASVSETCQAKNSRPSCAVVILLDETCMPVSSGPWPQQRGIKTTTILPGFEVLMLYMSGSPIVQICDRRNHTVSKEQEDALGESCSSNHGNPASGAYCSWFVNESCLVSISCSAQGAGCLVYFCISGTCWGLSELEDFNLPREQTQWRPYAAYTIWT